MQGEVTVHMDAPAERIWDLVSDVRNTGRFSEASGFIEARATSNEPVVMPPSIPPARSDARS